MTKTAFRTKDLILCAMFTALIAAGAFIRIPVPVIPLTLQVLFTTAAGIFLGPRLGALSVIVYIILGLIGIPIFTAGGGPGYIFQPTFGYLLGFAAGTWLTGTIAHKVFVPSLLRLLCACFSGLMVIYVCGLAYYWMISTLYLNNYAGFWPMFLSCFLLPLPGDIILCTLCAFLGRRLIPVLKKAPA